MHRNSGPDILGEYTHIFLDLYIQGKSQACCKISGPIQYKDAILPV